MMMTTSEGCVIMGQFSQPILQIPVLNLRKCRMYVWYSFSKFDIFEGNLPLYHIDRVVRETQQVVDNGFTEVYVNTKVKDGSEVSELMEVFVDDRVYNEKFPKTSEGKYRYKETEGG
jgi:hypothetical protein